MHTRPLGVLLILLCALFMGCKETPSEPQKNNAPKQAPADPTAKPADPTAKPADPTAKPADPTAKPADPTAKPADPTAKPADPTAKPADPTAKPADPTAKPADPTAKPTDPTARPATTSLLADLSFARYLPADTLGLIALSSARKTLDWSGLMALKQAYALVLSPVSQEMIREIGVDLLDLAAYKQMGVNLDAPLGLAWVATGAEERQNVFAFILPITERDFVLATLRNFAGRIGGALNEETYGEATLYKHSTISEIVAVVRGEHIFLIFAPRRSPRVTEVARAIALTTPDASLTSMASFKQAASLNEMADVAVFLSTEPLTSFARLVLDAERAELQSELTSMGTAKPSPSDEDTYDERYYLTRRMQRLQGSRMAVDLLLATTSGVALGGRFVPEGLTLAGGVWHTPESLWGRLLQPRKLPAAYALLDGPPMMLLEGQASVEEMYTLATLMAEVDGEDITKIAEEIKREVGLDIEADLKAQLTGGFGLAVPLDVPVLMRSRDFGFDDDDGMLSAIFQVRDPAAASAILARVAARVELTPTAADPKVYQARGAAFLVTLVGDQLVIGNQATIDALRSGRPAAIDAETANATLRAQLASGTAGFSGLVDALFLGAPIIYEISYDYDMYAEPGRAYALHSGLTAEQLRAIEALDQKIEQLRQAEINARHEMNNARRSARMTDIGAAFGGIAQLGLTLSSTPGLLRLEGGLFATQGTFSDTILQLVTGLVLKSQKNYDNAPETQTARAAYEKANAEFEEAERQREEIMNGGDSIP